MIAGFIKPILTAATLLLAVGPTLTAQDPKEAKTAPVEVKAAPQDAKTVPKDPKAAPTEAKPVPKKPKTPAKPAVTSTGNPMLGDQNPTAKPKKPVPFKKTPKQPKKPYEQRVDINNASKEELKKLPGVTDEYAAKIIAGRPYKSKAALGADQIIPTTVYYLIKDQVAAGKIAPKKP